jgi:hypothetical protein
VILTDGLVDSEVAIFAGRRALLCLAGERLEVFDLSSPRNPSRIFELATPGAAGLISHPGGFTIWGACGLLSLRPDGGPLRQNCKDLWEGVVQGAAWDGQYFYLLSEGQIHLLDRGFGLMGAMPAESATGIEAGQGLAFAGFPDYLEAYAWDTNRLPDLVSTLPMPGLGKAVLPDLIHRLRTLCVLLDSGGAQLLDFSKPESPAVLAGYAKVPWFTNACRFGDLLAMAERGSTEVKIFKLIRVQNTKLDSSRDEAGSGETRPSGD